MFCISNASFVAEELITQFRSSFRSMVDIIKCFILAEPQIYLVRHLWRQVTPLTSHDTIDVTWRHWHHMTPLTSHDAIDITWHHWHHMTPLTSNDTTHIKSHHNHQVTQFLSGDAVEQRRKAAPKNVHIYTVHYLIRRSTFMRAVMNVHVRHVRHSRDTIRDTAPNGVFLLSPACRIFILENRKHRHHHHPP